MEHVLLPLSLMICGFIFFIIYAFLPKKIVSFIDKTIIFPIICLAIIFFFILSIFTGAFAIPDFWNDNKE